MFAQYLHRGEDRQERVSWDRVGFLKKLLLKLLFRSHDSPPLSSFSFWLGLFYFYAHIVLGFRAAGEALM